MASCSNEKKEANIVTSAESAVTPLAPPNRVISADPFPFIGQITANKFAIILHRLIGTSVQGMENPPQVSGNSMRTGSENENDVSSESNFDDPQLQPNHAATNINQSCESLANGLSTMLAAVIGDFDSRAQSTLASQDHLNSSIDRLTKELDQLLEDAPLPFIMQHAVKISGVRKRVLSLNSLLKSIQSRLDNIDRMLSVGTVQEKTSPESS